MRELTMHEMEQVDGGVAHLPFVLGLGFATGAVIGYRNGGLSGAVVGGIFGAVAAFQVGVATAAYGLGRATYAVYSIGTALLGNEATSRIGD